MIKIICDHCKIETSYSTLSQTWITVIERSSHEKFADRHFCSWKCLSDYRKQEQTQQILGA
ncbi:hypothetical protein SAMN06264849_103120 [Melghirimyces algeriensis]|uniref:MYM-type domain-containing protein n=1 Tax=Melghirimyces algeriensis TaxID=910412 RepID=A0A521C474_9BACL|nr:hypothetical protein SAMN06264849_103120 [Melghirimyces algeriensis]